MALAPPDLAPAFSLPSLDGETVTLDRFSGQRLALIFMRFAGCPACNLHVRELAARHAELSDLGLAIAVVFHSPVEDLRKHMGEIRFPFPILGDPDRRVYSAYGVERSWAGMMSPSFMGRAMKGMMAGHMSVPVGETINGLPGDFLIDEHSRVRHAHRGRHAADSLTVDQLVELAGPEGVFESPVARPFPAPER